MTALAGTTTTGVGWRLSPATHSDVDRIVELRAVVMRPDLERLGRYDGQRVRQRLRDNYRPEHTWIVEADGAFAGCVALRPVALRPVARRPVALRPGDADTPAAPCVWLEHFYLAPGHQGRGLGGAVLRVLLARTDAESVPVRLDVLQGSPARRLYERHGFVLEHEDPVDAYLVRTPRP
jgi:GNAT superfamily N-acetyltransferase